MADFNVHATQKYVQDNINDLEITQSAIKDLTGIDIAFTAEETITAEEGATIIGDIRERTFDETLNPPLQTGNLATAPYSIAMGRCTEAMGYYSTALGSRTKAYGHYSIAGGNGSQALFSNSIALGNGNIANVDSAIAIGHNTKVNGKQSVGIGSSITVNGQNSIGFGYVSTVHAQYGTAFGYKSVTGVEGDESKGKYALAAGNTCVATGEGAIALGGHTKAQGAYSIALNNQTITTTDCQTAIGKFNAADDSKVFMIGWGNNEDGRKNIFSVNTTGEVETTGDIYVDGNKVALEKDVLTLNTLPSYPITSGTGNLSVRLGDINGTLSASGIAAVAFGANANAQGNYSIAGGYASQAIGVKSVALGGSVLAKSTGTVAIGIDCQAIGSQSVAIGGGTIANGVGSLALGYKTTAKGKYQTVIGAYNSVDTTSLFVIGNGDATTPSNACTIDTLGNVAFAGTITSAGKEVALKEDISDINLTSLTDVIVGNGATLTGTIGNGSVIIGINAKAYNSDSPGTSIAIGSGANAGEQCVTIGMQAEALGASSTTAVGCQAKAGGLGGVAVGFNANSTAGGVAIGEEATTTETEQIVIRGQTDVVKLIVDNTGAIKSTRATTDDDDDLVLVTKGYVKTLIDNLINVISNGGY